MFGCCKRAIASASVRKRARSASPAWPPARIIFRATRRLELVLPGLVDNAHAAAAQFPADVVAWHHDRPRGRSPARARFAVGSVAASSVGGSGGRVAVSLLVGAATLWPQWAHLIFQPANSSLVRSVARNVDRARKAWRSPAAVRRPQSEEASPQSSKPNHDAARDSRRYSQPPCGCLRASVERHGRRPASAANRLPSSRRRSPCSPDEIWKSISLPRASMSQYSRMPAL